MDAKLATEMITESKKRTVVKAYVRARRTLNIEECVVYGDKNGYIIFGEINAIDDLIKKHKSDIVNITIEGDSCNSSIPLKEVYRLNCRIEPGAIIRDNVEISDNAIVLMGAIINIGARIGEETMIDMGAIIGSGAIIGKRCHIGAGAVIAGFLEPMSNRPVIIDDDVIIGANAVILEGCHIGRGSVIGASSLVNKDVPENVVVYGVPSKIVKTIDNSVKEKTKIVESLRKI